MRVGRTPGRAYGKNGNGNSSKQAIHEAYKELKSEVLHLRKIYFDSVCRLWHDLDYQKKQEQRNPKLAKKKDKGLIVYEPSMPQRSIEGRLLVFTEGSVIPYLVLSIESSETKAIHDYTGKKLEKVPGKKRLFLASEIGYFNSDLLIDKEISEKRKKELKKEGRAENQYLYVETNFAKSICQEILSEILSPRELHGTLDEKLRASRAHFEFETKKYFECVNRLRNVPAMARQTDEEEDEVFQD